MSQAPLQPQDEPGPRRQAWADPYVVPPLPPIPPHYQRREEFRRALYTLTPRPLVTWGIIAANAMVFLAMLSAGADLWQPRDELLLHFGADLGILTRHGQWWRLLTAAFVHIGLIHIGMNMLVLALAGPFVERLLGHAGFLITYLLAGLAGSLASVAWNPTVTSAGASGAIFGVYGAMMGFVVLRRDSIGRQSVRGLLSSAALFIGYNVVFAMTAGSHIDLAAHLGGVAGGFVCGLIQSQHLTVETGPGRRAVRNILTLLIAGALLTGAALALPHNLRAESQWLAELDNRSEHTMGDLAELAQTRKVSADALARAVEVDIVPLWQVQCRYYQAATDRHGSSDAQGRYLRLLLAYSTLRQEQWTLTADALRTDRQADLDGAGEKAAEVQQLQDLIGRAAHDPL